MIRLEIIDPASCPRCAANNAIYHAGCLGCCARLLLSARPNKPAQNAMLAAMDLGKSPHNRATITAAYRALVAANKGALHEQTSAGH